MPKKENGFIVAPELKVSSVEKKFHPEGLSSKSFIGHAVTYFLIFNLQFHGFCCCSSTNYLKLISLKSLRSYNVHIFARYYNRVR